MTTEAVRLTRDDQVTLGLWMFLATVTMLFAAFASAYIVRRAGSDWRPIALPSILWWNTLLLAASSVAVEAAAYVVQAFRPVVEAAAYVVQAFRPASPGKPEGLPYARGLMVLALALGVAFLAGQLEAWRQLRDAGVYLPTTPHSSFFFMLTGAHAVHVVAALVVLALGAAGTVRMSVCRTFWHYLGGVWVFLFALMSLY